MVRPYGFTCLPCRRKKIRCDGQKPMCQRCIAAKLTCSYKHAQHSTEPKSRAWSGVRKPKKRIQRLSEASPEHTGEISAESFGHYDFDDGDAMSSSDDIRIGTRSSTSRADPNDSVAAKNQQSEITVVADGSVAYYGATSRFHDQPAEDRTAGVDKVDVEFHRKWLTSNARFYPSWEAIANENLSKDPTLDPNVASTLLKIYWTWQAPLHNCVYRACFFRDMALKGPYFSDFLLNAIYALASRHVPEDDPLIEGFARGELFLQKAKVLLVDELGAVKPAIPTIQGLLILGGRQCAVGKNSEGWLYTGMAIRMIKDLGLHLNMHKQSYIHSFEPDDLEVRKRLFLSAYAWDKSISLCLGRTPSLTEMPYHPESLLDFADDSQTWSPFYLEGSEKTYPLTKALTTLTFIHFCKLSQIINEAWSVVYSGNQQTPNAQVIFDLEQKLRDFHAGLPDDLRIVDVDRATLHCPPPHIFCLNILFHTLLILIYRPFLPWLRHTRLSKHAVAQRAHLVCIEEATKVNSFFVCYGRTFAFRNQTYLISYCVYTAATIEVYEVIYGDVKAANMSAKRLATTLKMLETEARQTPGVRRSVEIIQSQLRVWNNMAQQQSKSNNEAVTNAQPNREFDTNARNVASIGGSGITIEESGSHQHTQREAHFPQLDRQYIALPAINTVGNEELPNPSTAPDHPEIINPSSLTEILTQNDTWLEREHYDFSGGFVPDMPTWTWQDMVMYE